MEKKREIKILIAQSVVDAKILRTIAINKGFTDRKKFIEYLCRNEINKFLKKQIELL